MIRVPSAGTSAGTTYDRSGGTARTATTSHNPSATDSSVPRDRDYYDDHSSSSDILSRMILGSAIYKDAYDIFSADKSYGPPFLVQLEAIPYSFQVRDSNFWDKVSEAFGATSGIEKAIKDAFNNAMDEIRLLVQNYYTFKNSLPSEQVQQLQEAGINAAITGEGVSPSSMPETFAGALSQPNLSQTAYNNESLSQGVSSFVEFLGAMGNLASVGFNAHSLMGMLDIAERESYNKQETHDLILSQMGVTADSPFRVLDANNAPIIASNSEGAVAASEVTAAENKADAVALKSPVSVQVGNDPNNVATYEVKSGADWLVELSRYKIANRFASTMIDNLRSTANQLYASAVSTLENEYYMANYGSMIQEAQFNNDFFSARNGLLEGQSQTSLAESLASIRQSDANVRAVEDWMANYRQSIIEHWGQQLEKRPNLAPYFYKALLDFEMEDTFYHQNDAAQALKYGSEALRSVGSFLQSLTGFKAPKIAPRKTGHTTYTTSPNGSTITDTVFHYE